MIYADDNHRYQLGMWTSQDRLDRGLSPDAVEYADDEQELRRRQKTLKKAGRFGAFAIFRYDNDWIGLDE